MTLKWCDNTNWFPFNYSLKNGLRPFLYLTFETLAKDCQQSKFAPTIAIVGNRRL